MQMVQMMIAVMMVVVMMVGQVIVIFRYFLQSRADREKESERNKQQVVVSNMQKKTQRIFVLGIYAAAMTNGTR